MDWEIVMHFLVLIDLVRAWIISSRSIYIPECEGFRLSISKSELDFYT